MNDSKHSKGPWRYIRNESWGEEHKTHFGDKSGYVICCSKNHHLSCIGTVVHSFGLPQDEHHANAKFMAAAPTMYNALKSVNTYFVDLQNKCALTVPDENAWKKVSEILSDLEP